MCVCSFPGVNVLHLEHVLPAHISTAEPSSEPDPGQLSQLHFQRENVCVCVCVCVCVINRETDTV